MNYDMLFSPMKIGNVEIKNRIVMAPMCMGFGQYNGCATETMMNYYEERAKGGVGLIFTEITRINDITGASSFGQLGMSHDYQIPALKEMADRIHKHNCKVMVELHHPGRQNLGLMIGTVPICNIGSKLLGNMYTKILTGAVIPPGKVLQDKDIVPRTVAPSTVFAIAFGAYGILFKAMTYGTVTAIIQLVNQVQSPFVSLSGIMPKYYNTIASAERLMELDDLPDEEEINKNEIDKDAVYRALKSIEFENITFSFDRDFILDNTSLSINKGDFVAIMGISGIGKSTLLKLLLGVFNVNSGSIYLNTDNSKIFIDKNTRKLFSYVPQGNMLISGTIKDNITFINPSATDDEIAKAIEISCAKQFIDELPLGIETVIGEKGMGLSEGQIQRLAIARSLLANSPVLLLDEATSALDEQTEKQFLTNLKTLDNITCLIVSHKKAALDICNKSIKIKNGKIISEG